MWPVQQGFPHEPINTNYYQQQNDGCNFYTMTCSSHPYGDSQNPLSVPLNDSPVDNNVLNCCGNSFESFNFEEPLIHQNQHYHHCQQHCVEWVCEEDHTRSFGARNVDLTCPTRAQKSIPPAQSMILDEIRQECEHMIGEGSCDKCVVRHESGVDETIQIDDLVNIVMTTVENIKNSDDPSEKKVLSRKREQNKVAAARYRDKQKARWQTLLDQKTVEEERNSTLKRKVTLLEQETEVLRAKVMKIVQNA